MGEGFFPAAQVAARQPLSLLPRCGACGLHKTCQSPKMAPTGKGRKKILIVAEAPGADEDAQGRQLVGKSGQLLASTLSKFGVDMRRDCRLTNAIICRPPDNIIKNDSCFDHCRPNLIATVKEFAPEIIILLGYYPVKSLIGWLWKEDVGDSIARWVGWQIPSQRLNAWICPTYHPAFVLRQDKDPVTKKLFEDHLEAALELEGEPWPNGAPDFKSRVQVELDPGKAAKAVRKMTQAGGPLAFDYETTTLKPDGRSARIYCCAVSNGKTAIAYPWDGEAIQATSEFLRSPLPKIGHNIKFEERWTRKHLGHPVNNWVWDGMLAAHVLDNRREITGLKFQCFALLGQEEYDGHVKPYLEARAGGGNDRNRIDELPLQDLLTYCGMDALLEYKVSKIQMRALGYGK